MAGIIDLEHVDVGSIDFLLHIVRQMTRHPWKYLSSEMEKYADKTDYRHLMKWYKEFYPELFNFTELEKRLDLYELEDLLKLLPRFPKSERLHKQLDILLDH